MSSVEREPSNPPTPDIERQRRWTAKRIARRLGHGFLTALRFGRDFGVKKLLDEPHPSDNQLKSIGRRTLLKFFMAPALGIPLAKYLSAKRAVTKDAKTRTETEEDLDWVESANKGFAHPHAGIIRDLTRLAYDTYVPDGALSGNQTEIRRQRRAILRRIYQYMRYNVDPTGPTDALSEMNRRALLSYKRDGQEALMPASFRDLIGRAPTETSVGTGLQAYKQYEKHFKKVAQEVDSSVPEWIPEIILVETFFDPNGISRAGAAGCVQFMPATQWNGPRTFPLTQVRARNGTWVEPNDQNATALENRFKSGDAQGFRHVEDKPPRPNDVYANGEGYSIDLRRDPLLAMRGAVEYLCDLKNSFATAKLEPTVPEAKKADAAWVLAVLAYNGGSAGLILETNKAGKITKAVNPYAYMARLNGSYYAKRDAGKGGEVNIKELENAAYPLRLFGIVESVKLIETLYADPQHKGQFNGEKNTAENPFASYVERPTIAFDQVVINYDEGMRPASLGAVTAHLLRSRVADPETGKVLTGQEIRNTLSKLNPAITVDPANADFDKVPLPGPQKMTTFPDNAKRPQKPITFRMVLNLPPGWAALLPGMKDPAGKPVFKLPLTTESYGK